MRKYHSKLKKHPLMIMQRNRPLLYLLAFSTALIGFRVWYAASIGLAPDEAYYWSWSKNVSLHYSDHPPMIAWLLAAGTSIIGETALGIRLSSILLSALSTILAYVLSRDVGLKKMDAALAGGLTTVLPGTSAAAILATPDPFLGTCWLAAAILIIRLAKKDTPLYWYLLGTITSLALYAKYSALLIPTAALASVYFCPSVRKNLRTVHPYLALLLSISLASPYLLSEAASGFSALDFQAKHLGGLLPGAHVSIIQAPLRWLEVLGGQTALLAVLPAFWAARFVFKKNHTDNTKAPLVIMIAAPVAATMFAAIFTHPEQNWAALGGPIAIVAAVKFLRTRSNFFRHFTISVLAALLLSAIVHLHSMRPFLPLPPQTDPVSRLHGWEKLPGLLPSDKLPIVCDNYGLASQLKWHTRHHKNPPLFFSTDRPGPNPPNGNWLLLDQQNDYGDHSLNVKCESIHPLKKAALTRLDGEIVRYIAVSTGKNCTQL